MWNKNRARKPLFKKEMITGEINREEHINKFHPIIARASPWISVSLSLVYLWISLSLWFTYGSLSVVYLCRNCWKKMIFERCERWTYYCQSRNTKRRRRSKSGFFKPPRNNARRGNKTRHCGMSAKDHMFRYDRAEWQESGTLRKLES